MNIDIEAIVREEIRNLIKEHLNISTSVQEYTQVANKPAVFQTEESDYEYEFPREGKTRRNAEEMALHKQEKLLERRLTPEEKGEIKAQLHMDYSAENNAKEEAIKKVRIDKIAAEGMERLVLAPESGPKIEEEVEETIPEVSPDNLPMVNPSLFTTNEQQI